MIQQRLEYQLSKYKQARLNNRSVPFNDHTDAIIALLEYAVSNPLGCPQNATGHNPANSPPRDDTGAGS